MDFDSEFAFRLPAMDATGGRNVGVVAPDGHAVVFVPESGDGAGDPHVLDGATGTITPLPRADGFVSTVWGPNGWVFYAADSGLAAWRPGMTAPRLLSGVLIAPSTTAAF